MTVFKSRSGPVALVTIAAALTLPAGAALAQDAKPAQQPQQTTQPVSSAQQALESPQPPAAAEKPVPAATPRETLTGDWWGLRTRLKDDGLNFRADYVSESFDVVDGGKRRGTSYAQQVRWGADFDMNKIVGWQGATFHLTFNDRRGDGTSTDFVGNRLPIQEDFGGLYTKLTEASYEQSFDNGRLDIRVGYFAMGNDLGGLSVGCNFVNAAYCAHALTLSGDSGWYNYPNARWGGAIRYRIRPDLAIRTGVYQVNPKLSVEENAFKPFAAGTIGAFFPVEIEYDPGVAAGSRVLPGHYKLGAYYDTSRVARQAEAGTVKGRYGVYVIFDQMILHEGKGKRGVSVFGEFTAQPEVSSQITRWFMAGLLKTGTFAGRDSDTVGIGYIYAKLNPRLRDAHISAASTTVGDEAELAFGEAVIEASYGFQATRWLNIRPDIQYVIHPGAFSYGHIPNALAIGTQVRTQF